MKNIHHCNGEAHKKWNRRSFLQALGFSSLGSMALGSSSVSYAGNSLLSSAISATENDNILLIVRLFGGNDGLNTIVPLNQYDLYANYRPTLRHEESNLWTLNDDYAMPNFMNGLESMWGDGAMKVVNSVGYDSQSQSHFKGTEIWSAAKDDNSTNSGWLGRYFQHKYPEYIENPPEIPSAVQIGSRKNITFDGDDAKYSFSVSGVNGLQTILNTGLLYQMEGLPDCSKGNKLQFLRGMFNSTYSHADTIYQAYNASSDYTGGVGYNLSDAEDDFAATLSVVSRLIKGNLGTKVYTLTINGFDTHSTQANTHQALLTYLADAINYFYEDLRQAGYADKVMTMVVSEFGRRVRENGSLGTDHGIAGPIMFFGDALDGNGFIGEHSSLDEDKLMRNRDLQWHTDFKQVYATVLKDWLGVDETIVDTVVLDKSYEALPIFEEKTLSNESFINKVSPFSTTTYYDADHNTYIKINNRLTQHVVIQLYDLGGRQLGEVVNTVLPAGMHQFDIKRKLNIDLSRGYYIYKVISNSYQTSKKLMIV